MNLDITITSIILIILSYLIGCINGAYIFSKAIKKEDIRTYGSGNAGATNALRTYGFKFGFSVFLVDLLKGCLAIFICYLFNQSEFVIMLCGLCCVAGHNWPVFMGFRGGKGVSTSAGVLLMINFKLVAIAILLGLCLALITKMVSVGSLSCLITVPILFIINNLNIYFIILSLIYATFSIYQHRLNIKRILNGTENKLTFGKKN